LIHDLEAYWSIIEARFSGNRAIGSCLELEAHPWQLRILERSSTIKLSFFIHSSIQALRKICLSCSRPEITNSTSASSSRSEIDLLHS
jgi:hypothetical protein